MTAEVKEKFMELWGRFVGADLPIVFFYTDNKSYAQFKPVKVSHCLIAYLASVLKGETVCLDSDTIGCAGGRRYLGFSQELRPDFEYFLSHGIPGRVEGERYKKSPELVRQLTQFYQPFQAPAKYAVSKRWDKLEPSEEPMVVIFVAKPDIIAALFTLANFDHPDLNGAIAPFGSGCSSIVYNPLRELQSEHPRAVLGMFDISARPYVPPETLTIAIPWTKFVRMVDNMEESFLITSSWGKVKQRLKAN
ncbi:MAG: DUF169 domain-containing protein [Candidatus Fervidibacter sp.]|uniref:DUF169 domain-containing protein n=1 Tax=Candidatus Fervidibacter sp. TaxID=3100871 RepID=UPI00404AD9B9